MPWAWPIEVDIRRASSSVCSTTGADPDRARVEWRELGEGASHFVVSGMSELNDVNFEVHHDLKLDMIITTQTSVTSLQPLEMCMLDMPTLISLNQP